MFLRIPKAQLKFLGKHNKDGSLEILTLTGRTKRKRNRRKERMTLNKLLKNNCSKTKSDNKAINSKRKLWRAMIVQQIYKKNKT